MKTENEPIDDVPQAESGVAGRRIRTPLVLAIAVVALVGGLWWRSRVPQRPADAADAAIPQPSAQDHSDSGEHAESSTDQLRNAVIGHWKLERDGQRLLSLRVDGTATMDVTLTAWQAVLFGERMRFDILWSLDGDALVLQTTGGEPATAVEAITKIYGVVRRQPILEIDQDHMLLKDPDPGERDHDYRRLRTR